MHLLGIDLGSSFVKATLLDVATGRVLAAASVPDTEQVISAPQPGWAEQDPDTWWHNVQLAIATLRQRIDLGQVRAVGIAYQMHGLVIMDDQQRVLRPSIIWCDSRAVAIGEQAQADLGEEYTLDHLRNSPGNFTASKLRWVQQHEPDVYRRIHKIMLPGDFIAARLTGQVRTTAAGLSEGTLWDYTTETPAQRLLDHYNIDSALLPDCVPTFGIQGTVLPAVAAALGLPTGVPVAYRAGDQPNNAFSLNVLQVGEVAATAGTSGVVYGIASHGQPDRQSRVNTFLHVNHAPAQPRHGILLCINGTGILYQWLRKNATPDLTYNQMNALAATAPVGAAGLVTLPFGNGAERVLQNQRPGASVQGLDFIAHGRAHLLRSAQEGIVFALRYGLDVMRAGGVEARTVRAGQANLFLSPLFAEAFATATGATLQLYDTDGAQGAARGAGLGAGIYANAAEAFAHLRVLDTIEPNPALAAAYQEAYARWLAALHRTLAAPA